MNDCRRNLRCRWFPPVTVGTRMKTSLGVADYRWDSSQPLDPKNFNNEYESPESRKQLDKEEDIRALHEGNRKAQGQGKQGMLSGWMPLITVIGFVVLGFVIYMVLKKIDQLGFAMNVIQQQLGQLGK